MMKPKLLAFAAAVAFAGSVNAAFYVDEDTPAMIAAKVQPAVKAVAADPSPLEVAFAARRTVLGVVAKRSLDGRLDDALDAEHITIVGFGDSTGAGRGLGRQRADQIKQWFVDNGIAAGKIEVADDETYSEPVSSRKVASKATIAFRMSTRAPAAPVLARSAEQPSIARPAPAPAQPQAIDPMTLEMVSKVIAMARNNTMQPADAFRLIADLLAPTASKIALQEAAQAPVRPALIVPVVEQPRDWTLHAGKSLKENLNAWAADAGWAPIDWQASNPYRITDDFTLRGTFLGVLGQLAEMVPAVDLQVKKGQRTMKVVDARK